jgi:ubiquitin carboxyl-terminal hydrolase MINDY-1/2
MDLNPVFTSATSFRAIGDELNLFKQAGIQLVHGWLVDPESLETAVINKAPDYDSAVNFIAHADHTSKGRLVVSDDLPPNFSGPSKSEQNFNPDEQERIEDGMY